MNTSLGISTETSGLMGAVISKLPLTPQTTSGELPYSAQKSFSHKLCFCLAALGLSFGSTKAIANEAIIEPTWAKKTALDQCGSLQSNSTTGSANRAGFQKIVTNELKTAESLQISWGVQARDIGYGLNINNWKPYLEVRSIHSATSNVLTTIPLELNQFKNMDGSAVKIQTVGTNTTFLPNADYGKSANGHTNYLFSYVLSGESLSELQQHLVVGQETAFFLVNSSNVTDGGAYTLCGPSIKLAGSNTIAVLNGKSTNALPGIYSSSGVALELCPIPPAESKPLVAELAIKIKVENGDAVVTFNTNNDGQEYQVFRSLDLNRWDACSGKCIGDGQTYEYREKALGSAFFRVERKSPSSN